jgi:hypothetical protein
MKMMCHIYSKPSTVTNEGKRENVNAKIRIAPTRTSVMETSSTYIFSYINCTQIYVYRERDRLRENVG